MSHPPKVIGITGTIGSGKSLVGGILAERRIPVIDTDDITHELLAHEPHIQHALVELFGKDVMREDDTIDRAHLAAIVFENEPARTKLESVIHPAVRAECNRKIKELSGHPLVAILAPLLFEAGVSREYDIIWTVTTAEPVLRERLKASRRMSELEIDSRLAAQWTQEEKASRSSAVIDNSGTINDTTRQVDKLLAALAVS